MIQEFYRPLPYSVEVDGRKYALTPAYDNVLSMFADCDGLPDYAMPEIMAHYLLAKPTTNAKVLQAVNDVLFQHEEHTGQKTMDIIADGPYIYAGFMQAYGMDLNDQRGKLHWWKFTALLRGLPSNTRLMEIVQIRTKPMPLPTKYNAEERAQLARLKAQYAVRMTAEDREKQLQDGLRNMAQMLLSMAEKKE